MGPKSWDDASPEEIEHYDQLAREELEAYERSELEWDIESELHYGQDHAVEVLHDEVLEDY